MLKKSMAAVVMVMVFALACITLGAALFKWSAK